MSYPGDQQQPGDWGPPRPPQPPHGPVQDQAGRGGSPYDRPDGGPYGGSHGGGSYGGGSYDDRYDEQADRYADGGSFGSARPGPYGNAFENPDPYGGGPDPYGGGPGGYEPGDGPRPERDRKRLIISLVSAAVIVLAGAGAAFAFASGGGDKPKPAAASTSAAPTPTASPTPTATETGRGDRLASRATDPKALTLNEVFKTKTFKAGGRKYSMTARRSEHKCSPPTHGVKFRKALAKGGCTQVLRATFSNGKFIGTIGVLNLQTQAASEAAQVASRPKDAFILALPGSGVTKDIGQGLSLTTTEVDGHYLIMSWVQYPNGKKIASKDYAGVTTFVKATTYGSNLRTALNYRSMVGKPS